MFGGFSKNLISVFIWICLLKNAVFIPKQQRSKNSRGIFFLGDCIAHRCELSHIPPKRPFFIKYIGIPFSRRCRVSLNQSLGQNNPGSFPEDENISTPEYNFPLYERKWQKFWEESRIFEAKDPDVFKNKEDDEYGILEREHELEGSWSRENSESQIHASGSDSLTHREDYTKNGNECEDNISQTCNWATLNPGRNSSLDHETGKNESRPKGETLENNCPEKESWENNKLEKVDDRPKYYILSMIPYPSGKGLHVGHLLGYTAVDVIARYKRLNNFNVLNPIGFDCFGIPTEIYSEKVNKRPEEVTRENVENFKNQLKSMGYSFDFEREIRTSDVDYYKWTQWIFHQMFLNNLAYKEKDYVNYCPELGSELSNEEVKEGKSVRGGHDVFKRLKNMWKLKITEYANRLYEDLERVDYPKRLINLQKNWINPKKGYIIKFKVSKDKWENENNYENEKELNKNLYGFVEELIKTENVESLEIPVMWENVLEYCSKEKVDEVKELLEESLKKSNVELSKEGSRRKVETGMWAINPYNQKRVPIYATNGPINTNENINCKIKFSEKDNVNESKMNEIKGPDEIKSGKVEGEWYREYTNFNIKDWVFSRNRGWGEPIPISEDLERKQIQEGVLNTNKNNSSSSNNNNVFKIDKNVSKNEKEMMLEEIPKVLNRSITETMPQWAGSCWHYLRFVDAKNKDEPFGRELAKYWMPVDLYIGGVEHAVSHLLYSRFWNKFLYDINVSPVDEPFKKILLHGVIKTIKYYIKKSDYVKLDFQSKYQINNYNNLNSSNNYTINCNNNTNNSNSNTDNTNNSDNNNNNYNNITNNTKGEEEYLEVPPRMSIKYKNKYVLKSDKEIELKVKMKKMSKSRGNVVNPEEIIKRYGSDALRMHLMFLGPVEKDKIWSDESIQGVYRLLRSVDKFYTKEYKRELRSQNIEGYNEQEQVNFNIVDRNENSFNTDDEEKIDYDIALEINRFIDNMTYNMENIKLNKVSEFFKFFRLMERWREQRRLTRRSMEVFLIMLSPYAPHLAEHLWYLRHLRKLRQERKEETNSSFGEVGVFGSRQGLKEGEEVDKAYRSIATERWPTKISVT